MIDIDSLTLGQIKQIQAIAASPAPAAAAHPFVGKYVLCRCVWAGVHAGTLASADGSNVILKNARRLWGWTAKSGIALSGVAQNGIKAGCKIDTINPDHALTDVIEIIPCTDAAKESIHGA